MAANPYIGWLTSALELEYRRLSSELERSLKRQQDLKREINRKYARVRYQNRRIEEIRGIIRYLEDELKKARGKPRFRRIQDELADVRASITPYIGRRESIVEDIRFERFTYEIPLEHRIDYLKEQLRLIEEALKERPPVEEEEWIGPEETTGYSIFYSSTKKKYHIRDPVTKDLLRVEDYLIIETTASIETNVGHDIPVALEITSITQVTEADGKALDQITSVEGPIESSLVAWLMETGWDKLAKAFDTIDHAFLGKSEQPKRGYPCYPTDYPTVRVWMERRSRYVKYRRYPSVGCDEFEAE